MNAAGRSDPSPWSDPEHPLRQPDTPGVPNVQRGNRFLDLSWAPSPNNGDPGHRVPGADAVEPEHLGAGRQRAPRTAGPTCPTASTQQFQVRSRNRDPDWSVDQRLVGRRSSRAPSPTSPPRPSAARGDRRAVVTYTAPGDQGCAISQIQIEASGGAHPDRGRQPAHVHRPEQRHVVLVPGPGA